MPFDPEKELADAIKTIEARNKARQLMQPEFRKAAALEQIADEALLLRVELKTLRGLYATVASRR